MRVIVTCGDESAQVDLPEGIVRALESGSQVTVARLPAERRSYHTKPAKGTRTK